MLRTITCLALVLPFLALASTPSQSELKTLNKAHQAYYALSLLERLEQKCQTNTYFDSAFWSKYQGLITEKLGISLDKYRAHFLPTEDVETAIKGSLDPVLCDGEDLEDKLYGASEHADMALFEFEIATEFFEPLQTPEEAREAARIAYNKQVMEEYDKAYSIVVGAIVETKTIPKEQVERFLAYGTNAYAYRVEHGWKHPFNHYMPADKGHEWDEALYQNQKQQGEDVSDFLENRSVSRKLEQRAVFFITRSRMITARVPIEDAEFLLEQLGDPDWHWKDGQLFEDGVAKGGGAVF